MAELTPGDNNNEKEQENENVIEANDQDQQPEPTPNLEPAEAAVMVGLDKDNFGADAPTSDEINAAQNAQNQQSGPSAQDLANHQQNEDSIFTASPHSNDAAMAQINLGLQGIEGQVDGVIGSTLQQHQIEEEKAKKERERIIVAMTGIQNMQEFAKALEEQQALINDLNEKAQSFASNINTIDETLDPKIKELEDLVKQQEEELQALKDSGASQEEIDSKQLELDNSNKLLTLYKDTNTSLNNDFQAASQKLQEAQQQQMRLEAEISEYTDSDQAPPQELLDKLEAVTQDVQSASESLAQVESRIEFSRKMIDISADLHKDVAASAMTCQSEAAITTQAAFVDAVIKASEDGTFTAEETSNLAALAKGSGYSEERVAAFASDLADSGMTVLDADGNEMSPEQIENFILSEWKEIQEEKAEVEQELDTTGAELEELERQIQAAQQTLNQEKAELAAAQEALQAEQQQTVQATQDAQSIQEVMSQYEDINDYMAQNYSMSVGVGALSKTFGTGEDINVVGQDESRILKDNDGNFVYMSGEDQTLYTLAKNEDGSIKLDENGDQVKNILSPEEALSLQSQMYSEKLVPRNFVANDAFAENSNDDGFYETLGRSLIGMEKGEQQANIDGALEQQIQQEQLAKQEQQRELEDLKTAENDVAQKSDAVKGTEESIRNLEERKQQLLAREQELRQEALAHNIDLDKDQQTETAQNTEESETEIAQNTEESETEWEGTEAPTPKADIEAIELTDKILNLAENGSISQEEFDAVIGDASPELREKIENVLANDGIEITPPENDQVANNNVTPDTDEPSVAGNEPTPEQSPTLTVSYPAIGATAQVQVINAPKAEIPTNGVTPAIEYTSFADSPEFAATNDPKNPDATYAVPTNNHTNNVVDASDSFGKTLTVNQPQPTADGGLTPDQRATLEQQRIDQMRRNEELQQQQQNQFAQNDRNTPPAGNTGMM